MQILGPERYKLHFNDKSFSSTCAKGTNKFSGLAVQKKPKLYIVSLSSEILYVGATIQLMQARLRYGWSAKGKTGYYGYRWRHELTEADLDIWLLENPLKEKSSVDIETIEAEVVYLIRSAGQWPRYQTEIHFHSSQKQHRDEAERIYAYY